MHVALSERSEYRRKRSIFYSSILRKNEILAWERMEKRTVIIDQRIRRHSLNQKTAVAFLLFVFLLGCSNGDTSSTDDTAATLLYSAYGASFTPVPTGGCTDSSVPTISVGGSTVFTGASYYYYFYLFTGTGASNTFSLSFTSGEGDLWIGDEGALLIPSDFSLVEFRSENIGVDSVSSVSTSLNAKRCIVVPVTDAGSFTLNVQ